MDEAIVNGPGEGELLRGDDRTFLVKAARPELSLIEYDAGPGYTGTRPHYHERHTDAFSWAMPISTTRPDPPWVAAAWINGRASSSLFSPLAK